MRKTMMCGVAIFVLSSMLSVPVSAFSGCTEKLARVRYMPEEPVVKILLAKNQEGFTVDVHGSHNVYDPHTGAKLDAAFMASSYPMEATTEGIRWGQEFPGVYQVVVVPDAPSAGVFVNGVCYPGVVAFYQVENRLAAVNWVSLEDCTSSLMGCAVLPGEVDTKEALAAYAIALRSRIYQQLLNPASQYWDVAAAACGYSGRTVTRSDAPFAEAMKASRRVILQKAMIGGPLLDIKAINEIKQQMPTQKVQDLAREGKDAKQILSLFYPGQTLCVVDKNPAVR